jgi:hypothetical protein
MSDINTSSHPPGASDGNDASPAQDKAQDAAGQAQQKAQDAAGKAQESLQQQVEQRAKQAGEQVSGTAEDLRSVGEELRKQGKDRPAKLADRAAEQTEKVGSYLSDRGPEQMLHDVEDFGRERPWALMGAGLALGAVAARFLKASSRSRYQGRSGSSGASGQPQIDGSASQPPPPPRISADRTPLPGAAADAVGATSPAVPEPTGSPVVGP